jgi:hypothetical protein
LIGVNSSGSAMLAPSGPAINETGGILMNGHVHCNPMWDASRQLFRARVSCCGIA